MTACALLVLSGVLPAFGSDSTGIVSGQVVSKSGGGAISGVLVIVDGTELRGMSDLNGAFQIDGVPVGDHSLTAIHVKYRTTNIPDLYVAGDRPKRVSIPMEMEGAVSYETVNATGESSFGDGDGDVVELDALVVKSAVAEGSDIALLGVRQESAMLSDAIGADFMSSVDAGDAAEAMSKVTGASVVDDKYVLIRGLGDRYTNTTLNNISVPSADPDRRAVQMDQFPSSLLESIVTSKSFTPDQSGGFSGGSVNMRTRNFPETFFTSAEFKVRYNANVAGKDVLRIPGGGSDWTGYDDGTRELPADLPESIPSKTRAEVAARQGDFGPAQVIDAASKSFNNETYYPSVGTGGLEYGVSMAIGDRISLGGDRLFGYIFSFTYDAGASNYTEGYSGRYSQGSFDPASDSFVDVALVYSPDVNDMGFADLLEENPDVPEGTPQLGVTQTTDRVDWGAYGQIAFRPSLNHEFTLRLMKNQSASDRIARGVGESTRSDAGRLYTIYDLLYTERSINSYQLSGQSLIPEWNDARIEWRAATSKSTQEQPDFRTISYFWDFSAQQYASAAGVGNNRFFRDLEETSDEIGADFTLPFTLGEKPSSIKAGFNWMDGNRVYREKRYRWTQEANSIGIIENYPNPVGIISQTPNSVTFGNTIVELPNDLVNYDGSQTITAGYLMSDLAVTDRFRAVFGARVEKTEMETVPPVDTSTIRSAHIDQTDILPAVSLVYELRPGMNLRAAYGGTLARPLYRELADIRVEDPFNDEFFTGNPFLTITEIDNYDLRWEWFPGGSDVLAVGLFYKDFKNPIEVLNTPTIGSIQPQNLDSANLYGIEFEARFGLNRFSESLRNFSVGGNLALSRSEASIPQEELDAIRLTYPNASSTRELFGQSPYVFNFDTTYSNPNSGTTVTAAFNISGRRLSLVSSGALPDVFEEPAPQLDLILSQRISRRWRVKVSAKNLLDSYHDKSLTHAGTAYYYERYRSGQSFGVSMNYFFE